MERIKSFYLLVGTALSYLGLFLVTRNLLFPIPFLIFLFFSNKYFKNFKKALFLTAVFALPYIQGKALLMMDETHLFVISPFIFLVVLLSFISIKTKIQYQFRLPDLFIILFFVWSIVSFICINTYPEVLDGLFEVAVGLLFYFLCRIYLADEQIKKAVIFVFASILVFESIIALLQFLSGHPLNRFIEEGLTTYPYGKVASEVINLYRPAGTMPAPTWLSRFLNMLLPFLLLNVESLIKFKPKMRWMIIFLVIFAIFVSFTRISWAVLGILLIISFIIRKPKISFSLSNTIRLTVLVCVLLIVTLFTYPFIQQRWATTPLSFEEKGSFGLRIKLFSEAINILMQFPVFGVGLNRYVTVASLENITGVYSYSQEQVHNLLMLIACETGIPGIVFFIGFIVLCYCYFFSKRNSIRYSELGIFKMIAAIGGLVYLVETMLNISFLAPHYYLFHMFMAILVL